MHSYLSKWRSLILYNDAHCPHTSFNGYGVSLYHICRLWGVKKEFDKAQHRQTFGFEHVVDLGAYSCHWSGIERVWLGIWTAENWDQLIIDVLLTELVSKYMTKVKKDAPGYLVNRSFPKKLLKLLSVHSVPSCLLESPGHQCRFQGGYKWVLLLQFIDWTYNLEDKFK